MWGTQSPAAAWGWPAELPMDATLGPTTVADTSLTPAPAPASTSSVTAPASVVAAPASVGVAPAPEPTSSMATPEGSALADSSAAGPS